MRITKIAVEFIVLSITGILIGLILFSEVSINPKTTIAPAPVIKSAKNTLENVKKMKILCFLNTMPENHARKAVHIKKTWSKHCDKLIFASTLADPNIDAMRFNVTGDHAHLWGKVKQMFQYIHTNYVNDYDWFFKGDDDTFLIPENLKYLLSAYSPEDPIYFGHKLVLNNIHKRGYFSGGSGYVLSRRAVRVFAEKLLRNNSLCPIRTDDEIEDSIISVCFDKVNVFAGDGRDVIKRERFLPFTPEGHLFNRRSQSNWYFQRKYYYTDDGLDCCSNYTVSFHYISPKYQYTMHYLTYLHSIFGLKRKFPNPPARYDFSKVVQKLELERVNRSYRGY